MKIPDELKHIPQWVAWRWETRDGKKTKPPVDAKTGNYARSTDPVTWASFEVASKTKEDGIGFVVTAEDPYLGVDIDHCYKDGKLDPQAQAVIARLNSYTEITVSGEGVRVWVKAKLSRPGNKKHLSDGVAIEFYDQKRFFTVTGNHLPGTPLEIHERQAELDKLHGEMFQERPAQAGPFKGAALSMNDRDLIEKAKAAKNGGRFASLWYGDKTGHGDDDSAADLALLCHLAFWTRKDPQAMDRLFRQSGLYREKWERQDYRVRSINTAIERTLEVWEPESGPTAIIGAPKPEMTEPTEGVKPNGLIGIDDLDASIDRYYNDGSKPGEHPGWASLANLYRVNRGEWTLVTGIPSHGKSTWLDALIVNLIDNLGWKFAICSPENQPLERHFSQMAEKVIGKPFYGPGKMTWEEMQEAKALLREHVHFALPEAPTIDAVLEVARFAVENKGLDGLVVDPWNELDHSRPSAMSEGEYISYALTRFRKFARQHAIHLWLVAHPTKLQKERIYDETGKPLVRDGRVVMEYPVPDPYSVSGSAHWRNKADNCIAIYRNTNEDKNLVQVHVQKVRFRQNGKPGLAELRWNPETSNFIDTGFWAEQGYNKPVIGGVRLG